jgi:hypothetical protein
MFVAGGVGAAALLLPYIEAIYTLEQFIAESEVIAEGVVEKTDPATRTSIVKVTKSLKGKCAYTHVRMNIGVGQDWHPDAVMRHLVPGAKAVILYNADRAGEIYVNRFFMQLYGDKEAPPEKAWWNFTHVEIRCNRTFNGPAEDLSRLVTGVLAGKQKPPAPDPRLPVIRRPDLEALPTAGAKATDAQLPAPFKKSAPFKPRPADHPSKTARGLKFEYFEGQWQEMPDFKALTPALKGVAGQVDLSKKRRDTNLAFRFTGFVEVPKDGTYVFAPSGAGGFALHVGAAEVVRKIGFLEAAIEVAGGIDLKAGKHAITLVFFDAGAGQELSLSWEGPGLEKQAVPAAALHHAP